MYVDLGMRLKENKIFAKTWEEALHLKGKIYPTYFKNFDASVKTKKTMC